MIKESWCVNLRKVSTDRCTDCEAKSHLCTLESLDPSEPDSFDKLREAVIWILENTDWPTS